MTRREFVAFCQLLDATFKGQIDEPREAAIQRVFGRVAFDLATAVVDRLVLDGQTFVPVPGELVSALRRVVPDRTFGPSAALAGLTVPEYVERCQLDQEAERARRLSSRDQPALPRRAGMRDVVEALRPGVPS